MVIDEKRDGEQEERDEDVASDKVVLSLSSGKEQPSFGRTFSKEEKKKWSSYNWPSNLSDSFKESMEMDKLKMKLNVDAFQDTQ